MRVFLSVFIFFTQVWFNTLALANSPASCQSNKLLGPGETCCQIDSEVIVKCKAPGAVAAKGTDCQINPDGPTYHQWTCPPAKTGTSLKDKSSMECQKSPQFIFSQLVDDTNAIAKKCKELEKEEKNEPTSISLDSEGNYKAKPGHWYLNCKEQSPSTYQRYNLDTYFFADNHDKTSHKEVTDKRTQARTNSFKLTDSPEDRCEKLENELRAIFEEYKIKFDFPEKLTLNVPEKIAFKKWNEKSIKEVTDWLNEKGFGPVQEVSYLSKGGSSTVFRFKDKNGEEKVIKVLSEKHPKLSGQRLMDFYRAEMARGQSLEQVAKHFLVEKENGKYEPFLKARTSALKYADEGILIQKFIKGANANDISKSALDNDTTALANAGFKTKEDSERELKILETFYQVSFGIGDKVTRHFKVDVPNNHFSRTGRFGSPVGYDYNHGKNVIRNKNWVIFDY